MLIKIKLRNTNVVLYSHDQEDNTIRITLEKAVKEGEDLRNANLSGANLRSANLRNANLSGADLSGANLRSANLRNVNLSGADLSDAYLRSANLSGANLSGADLSGANLSDAYLRSADLSPIRDDLWAVLSSSPKEVIGVIQALKEGRVDGSTYEGECACLVGTIANIQETRYNNLKFVSPNSLRPVERFFMGIVRGDTPETNQVSKLAVEWCEEWLNNMKTAFST
jgi:hypothetical protein